MKRRLSWVAAASSLVAGVAAAQSNDRQSHAATVESTHAGTAADFVMLTKPRLNLLVLFTTLGAIGFEGRRDYGAVGPVTNLAARLCGEAQSGQILVSQRVRHGIVGPVEKTTVRPSRERLPRRSPMPGVIVSEYAVLGRKPSRGRTAMRLRCHATRGSPSRGEMTTSASSATRPASTARRRTSRRCRGHRSWRRGRCWR